jgi:phosphohistidine phosphatase
VKIYVMRHGPAEDSSPTGRDGDRALTPDGRERTRAVARAIVAENEVPLTIISSPLVRALQTAEIVAAVTDLEARVQQSKDAGGAPGAVEIRREMAPGGDALALVVELARSGRKRVMVVGHEPDLSMLVSALVGRHLDQGMLKSMVVGMRIEASKDVKSDKNGGDAPAPSPQKQIIEAELRFILDPKTLVWQRD